MNLDENTGFFRESFKGFNKDDVTAFVKKLSKDYSDNEDKYKEKILKLTAENKAKTEELMAKAAEIENLTEVSAAAIGETEERLKTEIENLNQSLKSSAADVDKYKDDVNKLLSEVRSKDAEIIELKKNASVSEDSGEETEELKIKYTEILKANEELKYKLEEISKAAKESHGANSQTVNELSAQVAELSAKAEDANSGREDALRELDALRAEKDLILEDLENQIEENRARIEDEQKIYEKITADLGSTIYSAKKSAEDILAKANSEAEDIISRANIKKLAILEESERSLEQLKEKYSFIKGAHEKVIESFKEISEIYISDLHDVKDAIENINKNI